MNKCSIFIAKHFSILNDIATTHNNTKKKKEEAVDAIYILYFIYEDDIMQKEKITNEKEGRGKIY